MGTVFLLSRGGRGATELETSMSRIFGGLLPNAFILTPEL